MLFLYFVYISYFKKFAREALCLQKKFLLMEKSKAEESSCKKKKRKKEKEKKRPKEERIGTILSRN